VGAVGSVGEMFEDGEEILNYVGIGLVLALVVGFALVALAMSVPQEPSGAPDANWTMTRINSSAVTIAHDGGEPVRASELLVTTDNIQRPTDWEGAVTENDSTVVSAPNSSVIRVLYDGGRGEKEILASWGR
jgi:hypothetical protein